MNLIANPIAKKPIYISQQIKNLRTKYENKLKAIRSANETP